MVLLCKRIGNSLYRQSYARVHAMMLTQKAPGYV